MQSNFEDLMRAAEDHYLQTAEISQFKQQVAALQDRLAVYEAIRDQELVIFQAVADQLDQQTFLNSQTDVEKTLTHWISITRYVAMAMLMDQPEILEAQLSWLSPLIGSDEFRSLNQQISEVLLTCLGSVLTQDQIGMIEPYLQQVSGMLIGQDHKELAMLG